MTEEKDNKIKIILNDVDEEFKQLDHLQRARFAIEQISAWQQKFNEAIDKIAADIPVA